MAEPTLLNVWLLAAPMAVMAAMHTTTMSASMTAYSTAVGPSSRFRNSTTFFSVPRMGCALVRRTCQRTRRAATGGEGMYFTCPRRAAKSGRDSGPPVRPAGFTDGPPEP